MKFFRGFAFAILLAVMAPACAAAAALDCAEVPTDRGKVTGTVKEKAGVCEFKGIPFAAPPVGDLRFAMPRPHAPWSHTLQATEPGSMCVQYPLMSLVTGGTDTIGDEDCLYLNVWQPFSSADAPRPVMVFIHGGGFISGSASGDMIDYNGAALSSFGDVVVVTINYRLGAMGFFSHPALEGDVGRGNYGLYDQIAALKWVQDNIANFGGDPSNVTIFGESAGGMSVGLLVMAPPAAGLFHKAINESGPMTFVGRTYDIADKDGETIAGLLGCGDAPDVLACLRAVDAKTFHETANPTIHLGKKGDVPGKVDGEEKPNFGFSPTLGGELIPESPLAMLSAGKWNKNVTSVIIGSNSDEMAYFTLAAKVDTPEDFKKTVEENAVAMGEQFGIQGDPAGIFPLYPLDKYENPRKAYVDLMGDMAFTCPSLSVAKLLTAGGMNTYLYHFGKAPDEKGIAKNWGAFHGAELAFIFHQLKFMAFQFKSKKNESVSKDMMGLWSSFAHTGVPVADGVPAWPVFEPAQGPYLFIDFESEARTNFKPDQCGFFESLMQSGM